MCIRDRDGVTFAQSTAILRMLGIRHGMYTTDANQAWEIDSLLDFMEDNYNDMIGYCFKPVIGAPVTDEDRQKFDAYFGKMVPFLNQRLEGHGKKWIAGTDHFSIADLKVYQGLVMLLEIEANPVPQEAKDAVRQKIAETSRLRNYLRELTAHMQPWLSARVPTPI